MIVDEEDRRSWAVRIEPTTDGGIRIRQRSAEVVLDADGLDHLVKAIQEIQLDNWKPTEKSNG